jgi:hypothetical protein
MNNMQQKAFLQGYLCKEAFATLPTGGGATPAPAKQEPGFFGKLYDKGTDYMATAMTPRLSANQWMDNKKNDLLTSTTGMNRAQRNQAKRAVKNPAAAIKGAIQPYEDTMKGAMKQGLAVNAAGQLGSAYLQNMGAQTRHKQMMEMMKRMYAQRQQPAAQTPPAAFRLSQGTRQQGGVR